MDPSNETLRVGFMDEAVGRRLYSSLIRKDEDMAGIQKGKKQTKYTDHQRTRARALRVEGLPVRKIAELTQVNRATVAYWFESDDVASGAKEPAPSRRKGGQKGGAQRVREAKAKAKVAAAKEAREASQAEDKAAGARAIKKALVARVEGPAASLREDFQKIMDALEVMERSEPMAAMVWTELSNRDWG